MKRALLALVLLLGICARLSAAELPSLQAGDLARGPFSSMRMLLEKTFLNIDVATINVRVGKPEQAEFSKLASGQPYSEELETRLAQVALRAERAVIQLEFLRDVGLERWMGGVRESLERARKARLISAEVERRVSAGLPVWFKAIEAEGFLQGDRILYEIRPGALRTVVVRAGKVLLDQSDKGEGTPHVVLASYFAPGTDFRTALLKSLLEPAAAQR